VNSDFSKTNGIVTDASFNQSPLGLAYFSNHGQLLIANNILERMLGYKSSDLQSIDFIEIVHPDDNEAFTNLFFDLRSSHSLANSKLVRCFNSSGKTVHLRFTVSALFEDSEMNRAFAVIEKHVTPRIKSNSTTPFSQKWFEAIAEHVPVSLWVSDLDVTELFYCNENFMHLWDLANDSSPLTSMETLAEKIYPEDVEQVTKFFNNGVENQSGWQKKYRIQHKSGKVIHVEDYCTILYDETGKARYRLGAHRDITETVLKTQNLERLNQELEKAYKNVKRLSEYDSLTGCLNREATIKRLSDALYQYTRYEIPSVIIYIDLNRFKQVNDKHGHMAGDQVLKSFVNTMSERIRQTDVLGRLGGDEFLLLFPGATAINANHFLEKADLKFDTQITLPNTKPFDLRLAYSVGIADLNFNIESVDEWIDLADKAMYAHKRESTS